MEKKKNREKGRVHLKKDENRKKKQGNCYFMQWLCQHKQQQK